MNDGEEPDDIRCPAMTEWEVRAADFEAPDVGPAKRRPRPGRARLCILLAPFTVLSDLAVRSGSGGMAHASAGRREMKRMSAGRGDSGSTRGGGRLTSSRPATRLGAAALPEKGPGVQGMS
jgi:hypothetical protein